MGTLLDLLLPARCPMCRRPGAAPCAGCAAGLPRPPPLPPPVGIDECVAVVAYEGAGRELVAALKFRGERAGARWAAAQLAPQLPAADVVTWLPTSAAQRHRRGADQAEVLARAVGAAAGLPVAGLLRRLPGPAQAGRGRVERLRGPGLAIAGGVRVPASVLVVDDVVTTGGSVAAAARALRGAGARIVTVAAVARTPR